MLLDYGNPAHTKSKAYYCEQKEVENLQWRGRDTFSHFSLAMARAWWSGSLSPAMVLCTSSMVSYLPIGRSPLSLHTMSTLVSILGRRQGDTYLLTIAMSAKNYHSFISLDPSVYQNLCVHSCCVLFAPLCVAGNASFANIALEKHLLEEIWRLPWQNESKGCCWWDQHIFLTFFTMHSLVCRVGNAHHTLVDLSSVAPCVLCCRLRFSWKEGSGAANGTTFITINTWTSRLTSGYSVDKCTAWFQVLTCYRCCASWCCSWRGKSLLHSWLIYPFLACPKSDIVTRFLFFSDGRCQRLEWKQSSSSGAPHGGMQLS